MASVKEPATELLAKKRTAVTGVSRTPKGHGSNVVDKRLRQRGHDVYVVNPNADEVQGDASDHDLKTIPGGVDAVVIATRPRMNKTDSAVRRASHRRATRRVPLDAVRDLLEAPPRASIAFRSADGIESTPVGFRFQAGRYWIGIPRTAMESTPGPGELVTLLIDDGSWFFDLRGLRVRGRTAANTPTDGAAASPAWLELTPEEVVAWDFGTLPGEVERGR